MLGRDDRGMIAGGDRDRLVDVFGQHLGQRLPGLQPAGVVADHLAVGGLASLCLRPCRGKLGDCGRAARIGLGDIGAGALADLEPRARGARLFGQELQVLFGQHRDLPVADNVHVGARRIEQRILFLVAQALDRGPHLRLGGADIVPGLEPVEQQLVDLEAE